jgi:uncharacterized membrane protein (GlpM family)
LTTRDVVEVAIKTVEGGILVTVFALISEIVKPKTFSGVFAAAPAVALAGLTVSGVAKGHHDIHRSGLGMIPGGVAMVAYCATVVLLHRRLDALRAASAALVVWLAVAGAGYLLLPR